MKRPGWAIAVGIIMLLFGGCGAFNRAGDLMLPELTQLMNEAVVEVNTNYDTEEEEEEEEEEEADVDDVNSVDDTNAVPDAEIIDGQNSNNDKKLEDLSEQDKKMLDMFSDTILLDENNNVDMESTIQKSFLISDYRQTWIKRFAYIGMFIAVLFILGGIMLLGYKKYTIKIVLTAITLSMTSNILQIVIYAADAESGSFVARWGSLGIYVSLALDILLLILVMVLDKTFFRPTVVTEDYYD